MSKYINYNEYAECENEEIEIPRYVKKKDSSKSEARYKSSHKHIYKEALFVWPANSGMAAGIGEYCPECGKIKDITIPTERLTQGYRMLSYEEVISKYKKLEKISVEDMWQKYIPVSVVQE